MNGKRETSSDVLIAFNLYMVLRMHLFMHLNEGDVGEPRMTIVFGQIEKIQD